MKRESELEARRQEAAGINKLSGGRSWFDIKGGALGQKMQEKLKRAEEDFKLRRQSLKGLGPASLRFSKR